MVDQPPLYEVRTPPELLERLRIWGRAMIQIGRGREYGNALRELQKRLEHDPSEWGDWLADYQTIIAHECRGMIPGWFLVWYGVDTRCRLVLVREIQPAPGSPLPNG